MTAPCLNNLLNCRTLSQMLTGNRHFSYSPYFSQYWTLFSVDCDGVIRALHNSSLLENVVF